MSSVDETIKPQEPLKVRAPILPPVITPITPVAPKVKAKPEEVVADQGPSEIQSLPEISGENQGPEVEIGDAPDSDDRDEGEDIAESQALTDDFDEGESESESGELSDVGEMDEEQVDGSAPAPAKGVFITGGQAAPAPFENRHPLRRKFSKEFLQGVPKKAGIYTFVGEGGAVLYVGKAKNLKSRMRAYWHSRPRQMPRKLFRLLEMVQDIKFEVCSNEKEAQLRESALLRSLKPSFNAVAKKPEDYHFVGVRVLEDVDQKIKMQFRLTNDGNLAKMPELGQFFGAFKGRSVVREGYQALLRLLWATGLPKTSDIKFEYPTRLTRKSPVYVYELALDPVFLLKLHAYLNGSDKTLLTAIADNLLENENLPPFVYTWIEDDFKRLELFFEKCLKSNFELRQTLGLRTNIVLAEQLEQAPGVPEPVVRIES